MKAKKGKSQPADFFSDMQSLQQSDEEKEDGQGAPSVVGIESSQGEESSEGSDSGEESEEEESEEEEEEESEEEEQDDGKQLCQTV